MGPQGPPPMGSLGLPRVPLPWGSGSPPMRSLGLPRCSLSDGSPRMGSLGAPSHGIPTHLLLLSGATDIMQLLMEDFSAAADGQIIRYIYIYREREREREKLVYVYEYIYIFMYAHDILAKRELIRPPTRTFHCHPRQSLQSEFLP